MKLYLVLQIIAIVGLSGCLQYKRICRNNKFYQYENNQPKPDSIREYTVIKPFRAKLTDKTDYYLVSPDKSVGSIEDLLNNKSLSYININICKDSTCPQDAAKVAILGAYFPENKYSNGTRSLKFYDANWGIQALAIPIKFRPAVHNDSLYPKQVETGFNANIAIGYKLSLNIYNPLPINKFMNRALNQYTLAGGVLFGLGATALKKNVNSPGLNTTDHSAATFSYGIFALLGLNNVSFGYALGFDDVLDGGKKYWIYQNKLWQGLIVSIDLLKF